MKNPKKEKLDFESLSDELFKEISQPDMLALKGGYDRGGMVWTLQTITVSPGGTGATDLNDGNCWDWFPPY